MSEAIEITMKVTAYLRRAGRVWSAVAPRFGVASQGSSEIDAKRCLQEALELWIESCIERGTLDEALREVGFRPVPWGTSQEAGDRVRVRLTKGESESSSHIIGNKTEIEVFIPAYQAAAFNQATQTALSR